MKNDRNVPRFPLRFVLVCGLALCILLFLSCFGLVAAKQLRLRRDAATFETVTALLPSASAASPSSSAALSASQQQPAPDPAAALQASYQQLNERNPDFYGWLKIDGTNINYPVMYTPTQPEYYLRRDFYKASSISGTPFIGAGCTENGHHWVIYGHNMENGSMFSDLLRYQKEDFWREHPLVSFDTCTEQSRYEVIAAFSTQIYAEEETGRFCYYKYPVFNNEDDFNTYVQNVKELSSYSIPATAVYGDDLITLSTCSYHTTNGRFVVVARKVQSPQP